MTCRRNSVRVEGVICTMSPLVVVEGPLLVVEGQQRAEHQPHYFDFVNYSNTPFHPLHVLYHPMIDWRCWTKAASGK